TPCVARFSQPTLQASNRATSAGFQRILRGTDVALTRGQRRPDLGRTARRQTFLAPIPHPGRTTSSARGHSPRTESAILGPRPPTFSVVSSEFSSSKF